MFDPATLHKATIDARVEEILTMLTYRRKSGSESEHLFIERFIAPLSQHPNVTQYVTDSLGNIFVEVAGGSDLLLTAHTDSVASESGTQEVLYDNNLQVAYTGGKTTLGADDAAGCWLLMEVARAGVPCWMAFFRAEEVGGKGSSFAADDNSEFFSEFKWCVSFDRKGRGDVITHQSFARCASDTFALHLSSMLNDAGGFDYKPSDEGVFTDSANLTHLIPECTNVGVGYSREHTFDEELDVEHLLALRDAVVSIDWQSLPVAREPGEDDIDLSTYRAWSSTTTRTTRRKPEPRITLSDLYDMTKEEIEDAMWDNPHEMTEAVWELLWGNAFDLDNLEDR